MQCTIWLNKKGQKWQATGFEPLCHICNGASQIPLNLTSHILACKNREPDVCYHNSVIWPNGLPKSNKRFLRCGHGGTALCASVEGKTGGQVDGCSDGWSTDGVNDDVERRLLHLRLRNHITSSQSQQDATTTRRMLIIIRTLTILFKLTFTIALGLRPGS